MSGIKLAHLENSEYLLNDPTRSFVREGNLLKRANRGRDVEYRFVLFSDVLIYAKRIQLLRKLNAKLRLKQLARRQQMYLSTLSLLNRQKQQKNKFNCEM